ncbi:MAG: DUF3488 and transglutaminase-like domain-containing protein, partial [Planctomycetota bacterium]
MTRYARTYRFLMILTSVYACALFSIADADPLLALMTCIGIPAGWRFTKSSERSGPTARLVLIGMTMMALAWAVLRLSGPQAVVSTFAEFVAMLLVIRAFDRKGGREQSQILVLTAFLVIASVLTSNGFWVALLLIPMAPLLFSVAVLHLISVSAERTEYASHTLVGIEDEPAGGARAWSDFRKLVAGSVVFSFVLAAVVFVALPRSVGVGSLGGFGGTGGSVTGFTDEIDLGVREGIISTSAAVVAEVRVFDRLGEQQTASGLRYLRGAVLERYQNGRWVRELRRSGAKTIIADQALRTLRSDDIAEQAVAGISIEEINQVFEISIRSGATGRALLTVWEPWRLATGRRMRMNYFEDSGVVERIGSSGNIRYEITSVRKTADPTWLTSLTPADRSDPYFSVADEPINEIDEARHARYRALVASEIAPRRGLSVDPAERSVADDVLMARLIEVYLRSSFGYTLELEAPPPRMDPIEWFLFDRQVGHCEFFAGAMAEMCRAVGIPARVVTGFLTTEYDAETERMIVRASNAHA